MTQFLSIMFKSMFMTSAWVKCYNKEKLLNAYNKHLFNLPKLTMAEDIAIFFTFLNEIKYDNIITLDYCGYYYRANEKGSNEQTPQKLQNAKRDLYIVINFLKDFNKNNFDGKDFLVSEYRRIDLYKHICRINIALNIKLLKPFFKLIKTIFGIMQKNLRKNYFKN